MERVVEVGRQVQPNGDTVVSFGIGADRQAQLTVRTSELDTPAYRQMAQLFVDEQYRLLDKANRKVEL